MKKYAFYVLVFFIGLQILVANLKKPKSVTMPGKMQVTVYDSNNDGTPDITMRRDTNAVQMNKMYVKTKPTPKEEEYFLTHK